MVTPCLLKYFKKDKGVSRKVKLKSSYHNFSKAFSKAPSPDITLDNISVAYPKKSRSNSRTIIVKKKGPEDFDSFYNRVESNEEPSSYIKFKK